MTDLVNSALEDFINAVQKTSDLELYNEAGLQHELAVFLRNNLPRKEYRILIEPNITYIDPHLDKEQFRKKELDLFIEKKNDRKRYCIELKFPVNRAFPRRMFQVFEDINFLEELVYEAGFERCYFLMATNLSGFWDGEKSDIYKYFRSKPNKLKQITEDEILPFIRNEDRYEPVEIRGKSSFKWRNLKDGYRYFLVTVG